MGALAALVPFKDYAWGALVILLISGGIYERQHLIDEGKAKEIVSVKVASEKAEAAAEAKIINLNVAHEADIVKVQKTYEDTAKADAVLHDSDAQRLREYDAYRRIHEAVGSAASGLQANSGGSKVDPGLEQRVTELERLALQLATAGREIEAALAACSTERDSLNGK